MTTSQICKEMALDILMEMPTNKKEVLKKALIRNYMLTSSYILEHGTFTVYKEGWYLELYGTRCKFAIYAKDDDGEFVFIKRKPSENILHKLYSISLYFDEGDFMKFR